MDVQLTTAIPFPGWHEFQKEIDELRADQAITLLQDVIMKAVESHDGIFRELAPLSPTNIHVLAREWVANLTEFSFSQFDAESQDILIKAIPVLCRQINGLSEQKLSLSNKLILPEALRYERRLGKLWHNHLEQMGSQWSPKIELGRSQRMFSEIWKDLLESDRIQIKAQHGTSFLDTPLRLLFILGILHSRGRVQDVRTLLGSTDLSEQQISTLLEICCTPLESMQRQLYDLGRFPDNIQNIFHRSPLIRINEWCVIAPLPYLLMQSWDLQNLFDGLECTISNHATANGAVEYYGALGIVFENYITELLQELMSICGNEKYVQPFNFMKNHQSPDGFLHESGVGTVIFEAKCYRIPQRSYENVNFESFLTWFSNLLGANQRGRPPLQQGLAFYNEWKAGNIEILRELPEGGPDKSIYVVVSYEDIPFFVQWREYRTWYFQKLETATHTLWEKTLVISIRELEILISAARSAGKIGGAPATFQVFHVLSEYMEYRNSAPDLENSDTGARIKDRLCDWILRQWPTAGEFEPVTISEARTRLFEAASSAGFPRYTNL